MTCYSNHTEIAIPLFGLNADDTLGALLVTARSNSESGVIAILPFAPSGTVNSDQTIVPDGPVDGYALIMSVLAAESGFIFDGVKLSDVQYLYFDGTAEQTIDVSFVPNRLPVDIGKPGGRF